MGKQQVEIDEAALSAARAGLGTATIRDTVNLDRIAAVTGQRVEWVVPKGTVD